MQYLTSITQADKENVYINNNSKPFIVLCDDLNDYVCKYNKSSSTAFRLFNEYISASFLKLWQLNVPDFCFINVKREHIPQDLGFPYYFFDVPCFGSLFNRNFKEVDNFFSGFKYADSHKFQSIADYFKIALFDIWLANDDRHPGNYNLLIDTEQNNKLIPIDHEAVFNTSNLHLGLYPISYEASILSSEIVHRMLKNYASNQQFVNNLENYLYLCVKVCLENLDNILYNSPNEWNIDKQKIKELLIQHIFNKEWSLICWKTFREFLQIRLNN